MYYTSVTGCNTLESFCDNSTLRNCVPLESILSFYILKKSSKLRKVKTESLLDLLSVTLDPPNLCPACLVKLNLNLFSKDMLDMHQAHTDQLDLAC
jgi:hypothetical protein